MTMRLMFRKFAIAAATLVVAGTAAASAAAHTSATCTLSRAQASCVGTAADRSLNPGSVPASLEISGSHARLSMSLWPLVAVFSSGVPAQGNLTCSSALGVLSCSGPGEVDGQPVSITLTGFADASKVITLTDGSGREDPTAGSQTPASQSGQPAKHGHKPKHKRHHHRHHRRGRASDRPDRQATQS
jgi:hypothetical protein